MSFYETGFQLVELFLAPWKEKLRLVIIRVAFASSGKVLSEKAILNLVHFLHERPG